MEAIDPKPSGQSARHGLPGRSRQTDGWGQADDGETGMRYDGGMSSSHKDEQKGTRKCERRTCAGNMMRQEGQGQVGQQPVISLRSSGKSCM